MRLREQLVAALQNKWVKAVTLFLLPWCIAALAAGADFYRHRGRIYPGVYLNEISLGGLKLPEAEARLSKELFSLDEITFTGTGKDAQTIALAELGINWNRKKTMAAIERAGSGRQGYHGRLQRLCKRTPLKIEAKLKVEPKALKKALALLAKKAEKKPREASFAVEGARVTIKKERTGRALDRNKLKKELLAAVSAGQDEVPLPIIDKPAKCSAEELSGYGVEQVMVSFSTAIIPALAGRVHNIKLGAGSINGSLLAPGETFSFEALVGEITREKGYREAPVIVGEELRPGIGGGLCQVSSTLYNAALLGNLEIVERLNHSQAIGYLPIGRDATIATGSVDLKFKNNRDHYILIGAEVSGGELIFRLFGPPIKERVEVYSSDIVTLNPPVRHEKSKALPQGEKKLLKQGKAGYTVKTWRVVYRGEKEISRELLSHDRYRPTTTVYRVGTGKASGGKKKKEAPKKDEGDGDTAQAALQVDGKYNALCTGISYS